MEKNHAEQMPLDDLLKSGTIQDLIELPEPTFNIAAERIRRAHLERNGYRYMDPSMPGCEG